MARPSSGYRNKDGKRVPGVTTIIGRFKDSGGLMWWAFDQGQACERGEISSLYDKRDEAAEAGTLAHSMVEAHIRSEPMPNTDSYPPEIVKQATQGFENFLRWQDTTKMEIVEQELALVSETYQFGGCPDAIMVRGELSMGDWKTSSSGPYVDWLLQLAAYGILWRENFPGRPITGGFHLCRFSKEAADFHHHFWGDLREAEEQFLLLRRAYDLDKKLKKRV